MSTIFIGMPAYNGERFIREAIESILSQTHADWKLLISDDASTDNTAKIAQEYTSRDRRITYVRHPKNLGLFENFHFTLEKADAPYFMWASQDDVWEKDFIRTCLGYLESDSSLGLATTCNATIDSFGRQVLESPWMTKLSGKPGVLQVAKHVLDPEGLGKCNLMYSIFRIDAVKKTWEAYPQRNVWGQDYIFSLAAISRFGVAVDEKFLFKKRLGGFSSPQFDFADKRQQVTELLSTNPKNHMFPFGRFKGYFDGHMEALRGTPYRPLVTIILYARLPRSLLIHIRERNLKKFFKRIISRQ
ncbi:MAG: glycosyltransferase family 2 protein [Patescibacteria group bacterium]